MFNAVSLCFIQGLRVASWEDLQPSTCRLSEVGGAREWPPLPSSARVEEGRGLYHLSLTGRRGEQGSPGVPSRSDFSTRLGQEEA